MTNSTKHNMINRALEVWVGWSSRHAWQVCLFFLLLSVLLAAYTVRNIGINTDTADMLSEKLPWRQTFIEHESQFPQFKNTLVVVIDASSRIQSIDARDRLASALRARDDLFSDIYAPGGGDFFNRNGLLFLDLDQLDDLTERLAQIQPFLGQLARGKRLTGFFDLLAQALENSDQLDQQILSDLLQRTTTTIDAIRNGAFTRLNWSDDDSTGRQLLILKPRLAFDQLLPAKQAITEVREIAQRLNLDDSQGIQLRLTGNIALQTEELESLASSMPLTGTIALIMVAIVLFVAMRSVVLVLSSVLTLLVGLTMTAAFAAFAVGELNLISVAFAVLFIGLGIDFAIHFCLRYKELIAECFTHEQALRTTGSDVGASLALCAVTTSVGFYAFFPTAFKGVSELGIISGTGMLISLIATVTLLPALLSLKPAKLSVDTAGSDSNALPADSPQQRSAGGRLLLASSIVLGLGSLLVLPYVSFDNNPLNLRAPDSESVATYRDLLNDPSTSPLTLSAIAANYEAATSLRSRLEQLPEVEQVIALDTFIPLDQQEKLLMLEDLAFILGGNRVDQVPMTETETEQLQAIFDLYEILERSEHQGSESPNAALSGQLAGLLGQLEKTSETQRDALLQTLSDSLLGDLLLQLKQINLALDADTVSEQDLPDSLVDRWKTADDRYRVEILPKDNLSDNAVAESFVNKVTGITQAATGVPIVHLEAGNAVVGAFQQAFVTAFVLILLILLILLRNLTDSLLVLTPLVLAAPLTAAASVFFGIPFNFANIITLPLLLGISVDNGIHMVHRARHAPPGKRGLLASSTGRAVLFSAVTTVMSFGNLAFSPHVGTASMGKLLSAGMLFSLFCTLVLLPALIKRFIKT